ncbi:MAG: helix-turn-helix domain-containing protein [Hyphomicrobiales bacterium]|nr:helix-turn-helix domain-containing protein [Hyphomicrobiales bacterium]
MSGIEFTRVPTLPPIVEAMRDEMGSNAIRRSFDALGLRTAVIHQRHLLLPMRDLFGLLELFARERGDQVFGAFAASAFSPESFGLFVRYAAQAPTLHMAIERLNRGSRLHQSCSTMSLRSKVGAAEWSYRVDLPLSLGRHHHAVHVLLQLRDFVTQFLGRSPKLVEVGLEAERYGPAGAAEGLFSAPIRWSQSTNYLSLPSELLLARRRAVEADETPITCVDLLRYARDRPPRTMAESVEAAMNLSLTSDAASIDSTARYLNLAVRTLQRRLAAEGVTHQQIVERARGRRARELIAEGNLPLNEISRVLGYSDAAHFTRAYRRWHGFAPSKDPGAGAAAQFVKPERQPSVDVHRPN